MTIMEYYRVTATDEEGIESREPVRYVFEKTGKGVDLEHNHDLLTLDDFKRSRRMLEIAAKFVAQGFSAADVFNALRADDKPQIQIPGGTIAGPPARPPTVSPRPSIVVNHFKGHVGLAPFGAIKECAIKECAIKE